MENTGQYSVRSGYNPLMQGIGSSDYNGSPRISNDGRRLSKCGNAQCLLKCQCAVEDLLHVVQDCRVA
ncbi:hypothetical protein Gotur_023097, partial [Gossypium turneri]